MDKREEFPKHSIFIKRRTFTLLLMSIFVTVACHRCVLFGSIKKWTGFPFDAESARDEFPFDRSGSRDNHFQSTLDDLAKRHPELAGHFQNINQRPRSRSRPSENFKAQFSRRPFGENFPFDEDFDIDPQEYVKQFYNEPEAFYNTETNFPQASSYQQETPRQKENSSYTQQPAAQTAQPEHKFVPPKEEAAAKQPEPEKTGIQQSSTVDLGQKQEPIDDRNQRSMSAPPGGETKKRYTSSINIPVNTPPQNMSQNQQQSDVKSNERIIPIQIEGRDDPVIPKNTHIPQAHSQSHSMPGVFGPRQDHFQRQFPDDYFYRANIPHNFHQQKQDIPIPVQKETPAEQKQHQPQQQQPPPQQQQQPPQPQQPQEPVPEPKVVPPERKPRTPIEQIQEIQKDVSSLMEQVENFTGQSKDKQYLFLDEMLTRNLIKLDNIDTQGQETIRQARKEAIKCIQQAIALLESKATGDSAEKMDVDEKQESLTEDNKPETNSEEVRSKEANSEAGSSSEGHKTNVSEDSTTQEQNKSTEPVNMETSGESINQENRAVLVEPVVQANEAEAASENVEDKSQVDSVDSKDKKKEKKVKKGKKDCSPH